MPRNTHQRLRLTLVLAVVLAPLAVIAALVYGHDPVAAEAERPLIHRADDYVGSAECASCHPDHHASWAKTYHRTMTQRASPETVVGGFDGRVVEMFGGKARPFREGDRFFMEVPARDGSRYVGEVALAVGSHRYQQYFELIEREGGTCYRRLPLLWHIGAQRWMHLNGVFLAPDDDDWSVHASIWNENCIFCHNTGPRPGIVSLATRGESAKRAYDSSVGELGIACEACHGPGGAHARRNRDPLTRYARAERVADIIAPAKLDHEASSALCGQCHGQRLPFPQQRIEAWLQTGPTYRPGNRLTDHVTPITRETPSLNADPGLFRDRFWGDGTARLSAYEMQGVSESPCFQRGQMSCGSCHTMHGGDPAGMVEPDMRSDRACVQCHEGIGRDVAAHTKHAPDSAGARCLDCHMPRMVYGILSIHRSHKVEVPDPKRDGESGRPHACTLCHADKTLAWSAREMNRLWGDGRARFAAPDSRPDQADLALPDAMASLLCGDAVQRAVYAAALGRPGLAVTPDHAAEVRVALIATLFDAYASVRWLAWRSLQALEVEAPPPVRDVLAAFDHVGARETRERVGRQLFATFAQQAPVRFAPPASPFVGTDFAPNMQALVPLLNLQSQRPIAIGE
ncbi:MAG: cytochrome c3 family protein [Planctomycetota bacterium]